MADRPVGAPSEVAAAVHERAVRLAVAPRSFEQVMREAVAKRVDRAQQPNDLALAREVSAAVATRATQLHLQPRPFTDVVGEARPTATSAFVDSPQQRPVPQPQPQPRPQSTRPPRRAGRSVAVAVVAVACVGLAFAVWPDGSTAEPDTTSPTAEPDTTSPTATRPPIETTPIETRASIETTTLVRLADYVVVVEGAVLVVDGEPVGGRWDVPADAGTVTVFAASGDGDAAVVLTLAGDPSNAFTEVVRRLPSMSHVLVIEGDRQQPVVLKLVGTREASALDGMVDAQCFGLVPNVCLFIG